MVKRWAKRARALSLGLTAAALGACASVPAPITGAGPERERPAPRPHDPSAPPRVVDYSANLQCVPYAREVSGIAIYGDANTWWRQAAGRYPRSHSPAPGAVIVMRGYNDATRGHVAVIRRVESERIIVVDQANWLNGGEISVGVPMMDVSADNDWSEVRVWYIPGGHWGGRAYQVEGFIHPFALQAALS